MEELKQYHIWGDDVKVQEMKGCGMWVKLCDAHTFAKKQILKERERIIEIIKQQFKDKDSGFCCGCFEGDINQIYETGCKEFVDELKVKIDKELN